MNPPPNTSEVIANAYREDLADRGDITSMAVLDPNHWSSGVIVARDPGCVAGVGVMRECFAHIDPATRFVGHQSDGDIVEAGTPILEVDARTVSLLTAERVALNLFGRMSGIATATRAFVEAVEGTNARITDTRKTTPGLRALEKYAVTLGGGVNHRFGLYDAILIKDNHIAATGSIRTAVEAARAAVGGTVIVEVEVDTLDQLDEVLHTNADRVLLDNMSIEDLASAVERVDGRMVTEASGGVTLETVRSIAETGVDIISVGWLTHSVRSLDVALDILQGRGESDL